MIPLKFKRVHPLARTPVYATPGSACFDVRSVHADTVAPTAKLDTGLAFEIPAGHVMLVFSRSGHGFNNDIRLSNCTGVIDSDYRGTLRVKLAQDHGQLYEGEGPITINAGDRIAQCMVLPVEQCQFLEVDELSETERGTGGLGSTGPN